eukprot:TRINITY_DN91096_c0_g1_i1.p1 TRINITY_DN91096_c0_g1~~TRINITY_DN91096_c0_g1_i1.p1  ORF type:complete len:630 (-),score=141.79 TRINITY_DN91096_c0_g1_i1:59-1948(-)
MLLQQLAACLFAAEAVFIAETLPHEGRHLYEGRRAVNVRSVGGFQYASPADVLLQSSARVRHGRALFEEGGRGAGSEDLSAEQQLEYRRQHHDQNHHKHAAVNHQAVEQGRTAYIRQQARQHAQSQAHLSHQASRTHSRGASEPAMRRQQAGAKARKTSLRSIFSLAGFGAKRSRARHASWYQARDRKGVTSPRVDLNSEEGTHDRMIYAYPHTTPPALPPTDRYFLYDTDEGGLNNIRIGWEMAGILAQHTKRTLVLPPSQPYYLMSDGGRSDVQSYIELDRLKAQIPTLTFKEFYDREHERLKLPASLAQSEDGTKVHEWKDWARTNLPTMTGGDPCDISRFEKHKDNILYFSQTTPDDRIFVCGDWASIGQPRFTQHGPGSALFQTSAEGWSLMRNGFTWHPDAFKLTSKIVHNLGLFDYVALHARYNDFQFKDKRQPVSKLMENMGITPPAVTPPDASSLLEESSSSSTRAAHRANAALSSVIPFLKNGAPLYISTDEKDPAFFKAFEDAGVKLVHWEDVAPLLKDVVPPQRTEQLKGIVEQMTCAYARVFVATELSTFSNYAQRMRIYADAPVKERLYHTVARTPEQDKKIEDSLQAWDARGGAAAFKADDPNLVSLAYIPPSR